MTRRLEGQGALDALSRTLDRRRFVALTGAGISTESGIPDYRGPESRNKPRRPIQHHEFLTRAEVRARYWARSTLGFAGFARARPNDAHRALVRLEQVGRLTGLVTQNVDGLHAEAGSRRVVELHGALRDVFCLACGGREPRPALQTRLEQANPFLADAIATYAPDGDAELDASFLPAFRVVDCERCGGALMPSVVFFGGSVPRPVVDEAFAMVDDAEALLVVGSSLTVYSGYRFAKRAADRGIPLCIVNLGETRADPIATLHVQARAGELLPALAARLTASPAGPASG